MTFDLYDDGFRSMRHGRALWAFLFLIVSFL
ncbi:MAG: DUF4492 domain-containing protein [Bacteroidaceae bacterium]|nr:DUF4492 domain-containing protein [Bacteroidaceae bacterium]MDE6721966.1 DUF4492 domain-containing protein [Bacteroidaceae bacterium]